MLVCKIVPVGFLSVIIVPKVTVILLNITSFYYDCSSVVSVFIYANPYYAAYSGSLYVGAYCVILGTQVRLFIITVKLHYRQVRRRLQNRVGVSGGSGQDRGFLLSEDEFRKIRKSVLAASTNVMVQFFLRIPSAIIAVAPALRMPITTTVYHSAGVSSLLTNIVPICIYVVFLESYRKVLRKWGAKCGSYGIQANASSGTGVT